MQEEHRKDLEALERLKRFIPKPSITTSTISNGSGHTPVDDELDEDSVSGNTIIGTVQRIIREGGSRKWTVPGDDLRNLIAKDYRKRRRSPNGLWGGFFASLTNAVKSS